MAPNVHRLERRLGYSDKKAVMYLAFVDEIRGLVGISQASNEATSSTKTREISPEAFSGIVDAAIRDFGVGVGWLSGQFTVTKATVSRWRHGEAAPGPYMRREIAVAIANFVEAIAVELS
jgi:hypothetical protein